MTDSFGKRVVSLSSHMRRVLFTCGGTAGHVNPALALAQRIRAEDSRAEFLFVGAERGLERDLVEKAGYPFRTVHISNFHRSFAPGEIRHNLISLGNLIRAPGEARAILRDFRPDVVVGTGGYASYPAVKAAAQLGIPTAVHESNMVPGLTTKLLEKSADRIMVGFEACRAGYRRPEKVIVTGTPVRGDFFACSREEAKRRIGADDGRPLVVSFWGSLGASGMNRIMADFIALEIADGEPLRHIHGAGKSGYGGILERLRDRGVDPAAHTSGAAESVADSAAENGTSGGVRPAVEIREYIYDMALVMRAADLVICRAGASTLSELTALGVPALLIPSPYVTNHHQEKNARALEAAGGAAVLTEPACTGKDLYRTARSILADPDRCRAMSDAMGKLGVRDATERILAAVQALCDARADR